MDTVSLVSSACISSGTGATPRAEADGVERALPAMGGSPGALEGHAGGRVLPGAFLFWVRGSGWPWWGHRGGSSLATFLSKRVLALPSGRYFPYGILLIFSLDSDHFLQKMSLFAKMSQRKVDDKVRNCLHFFPKGSRSIILFQGNRHLKPDSPPGLKNLCLRTSVSPETLWYITRKALPCIGV